MIRHACGKACADCSIWISTPFYSAMGRRSSTTPSCDCMSSSLIFGRRKASHRAVGPRRATSAPRLQYRSEEEVTMASSLQFTLLSGERRARSLTTSWRANPSRAGQLARLGRHDEVVLVETLNFLGLPGHLGPAPSEADIGMMTLDLGQVANLGNEVQRFLEVLEGEGLLDTASRIRQCPTGRLLQKF